ncbi:MAG: nicotinate phosphoribosyltransferase [Candidatus Spechtbacteria bacterium]|nr:nicotinate phosphoribosyltransferase [Candidatus Spechtbacteria bacterium]
MIPLVTLLLDTDFYKFTMGQVVFHRYPNIPVRYAFKNRTRSIHLADFIKERELRSQLDYARTLRFERSELDYLRGIDNYGARMFEEDYLEFLKNFRLPPYDLAIANGEYILEFPGAWQDAIYWEVPALKIVNALYSQARMRALSRFEQECVFATGKIRLKEKQTVLRARPDVKFSDFGTRRCFSGAWQDYALVSMAQEVPRNLLGTSNVKLAKKHNLMPMGTSAHEMPMILSGMFDDVSENPMRLAQRTALEDWWDEYGQGLSIYLPDTWGTPFGLSLMTAKEANEWKGFRQDSGDPIQIGEIGIKFYESCGVDPTQKLIVFSDGLDINQMCRVVDHFKGRIRCTFGWGTNLTNDLGFEPISIVIKPIEANGHPVVKLSDNIAKATGDPVEIERAKVFSGYAGGFCEQPKY